MFNAGFLIPIFQDEERERGRRDAEDGLPPADPNPLGWGTYQDGYDEVAESKSDDDDWLDF